MKRILKKSRQFIILALFGFPTTIFATPITLQYSDISQSAIGRTASGNTEIKNCTTPVCISKPALETHLLIPGFDNSLGELVSARLTIDAFMSFDFIDHAGYQLAFRFPVEAGHNVTSSVNLQSSPNLREAIEKSNNPTFLDNSLIEISHGPWSASDNGVIEIEQCVGTICVITRKQVEPGVQITKELSKERHFDQIFMGAELDLFQQDMEFYSIAQGGKYISLSGTHSHGLVGGALESLLTFPTEPAAGTKPGKGGAALLAARMLNLVVEEQTGHGIYFSDMHMAAAAELGMSVEYTYTATANSVSEPSALGLLGLGLAGLGLSRRRRLKA